MRTIEVAGPAQQALPLFNLRHGADMVHFQNTPHVDTPEN